MVWLFGLAAIAILAIAGVTIPAGLSVLQPTLTPTVTPSPTITPTPLAFNSAAEGECLIVIATFHETAANQTEPHVKIKRAIEDAAAEVGLDDLRLEIEPTILTADQREEAEALGAANNAEMVIWGEDTGVQVLVNFYNLKQPDFDAADVPISEEERTQVANPSAYAKFILKDLPAQLTFLAFFAVGQSYYSNEQYQRAAEVIEAGITAVEEPDGDINPDGRAEAYFGLGWLYQALGNPQKSLINYDQAIDLDPEFATAYYNRGLAYANLGEIEQAAIDLEQGKQLADDTAYPSWVRSALEELDINLEYK
ncbi:MAG: tetratricopeptide repeat protein [Anaerolineae bacterium]|nr:tetratricopeptide repeat protein [Anaerolineae bacterium]